MKLHKAHRKTPRAIQNFAHGEKQNQRVIRIGCGSRERASKARSGYECLRFDCVAGDSYCTTVYLDRRKECQTHVLDLPAIRSVGKVIGSMVPKNHSYKALQTAGA